MIKNDINGNIGKIKEHNEFNNNYTFNGYGIINYSNGKLIIDGETNVNFHLGPIIDKRIILSSINKVLISISDIIEGRNGDYLLFTNNINIEQTNIARKTLMILNINNGLSDSEQIKLNDLQLNIKKLNKFEINELKLLIEKKELGILKNKEEFYKNKS